MRKMLLRYIFLALLLEIVIVTPVFSQGQTTTIVPPFTSQFGQHYNVKVGDEVTYKYQTLYDKNGNFPWGVVLENNSFIPFNLTQGMKFTIFINSTANQQVEAQFIYNLPKIGRIVSSSSSLNQPYLSGAFDNYSIAKQYVTDQSILNPRFTYSISGNYITAIIENPQTSESTITNWKTGWLESDNSILTFLNGTIIQHIQIVRINTIYGMDLNSVLTLATYSMIPLSFAIGALLAIRLRKQKKNSN